MLSPEPMCCRCRASGSTCEPILSSQHNNLNLPVAEPELLTNFALYYLPVMEGISLAHFYHVYYFI
jgi:hypothetical protein